MGDEFNSGFDSFEGSEDSFTDVSMDDLSGAMDEISAMDEVPTIDESMDSFDDLEETVEVSRPDFVMDIMDDTAMEMDDGVFEDENISEEMGETFDADLTDETMTEISDGNEDSELETDMDSVDADALTEYLETDISSETIEISDEMVAEISLEGEAEIAETPLTDMEDTDSVSETYESVECSDDAIVYSEQGEVLEVTDNTETGDSDYLEPQEIETSEAETETVADVSDSLEADTSVADEYSELDGEEADEDYEKYDDPETDMYVPVEEADAGQLEPHSDVEATEMDAENVSEIVEDTQPFEESGDTGEVQENSALDNMSEYMSEHNYGPDDFETYSKDPEWQQLNNELLEELGREPIDYSEISEDAETSAMDSMTEYMYDHNYGRDDFEIYSQDPEWQQLNNDLLEELGREPIDYGESSEVTEVVDSVEAESGADQTVAELMDGVEVEDDGLLEDGLEQPEDTHEPESDVGTWMDTAAASESTEMIAENELSEGVTADEVEEPAESITFNIEHNTDFIESILEERPELAEMFEHGEFFEQGNNEYGFDGTCGETTQANTLNHLLGITEITENDVLNVAIDNNLCEVNLLDPTNSGGTSTEQFMQLYEEMNHRTGDSLNVECFDYDEALSIDDMVSRLEDGSVLNIAVDSYELWDQTRDVTDVAHYTDHWISVTGVDRGVDGNISGFKIIDSGGGESYLDIEKFERCYYGAEDNPVMDPTCIVVSRKEK